MILSTHILSEVEKKLRNRAIIIQQGSCVAEGSVEELGELVGGKSIHLDVEGAGIANDIGKMEGVSK